MSNTVRGETRRQEGPSLERTRSGSTYNPQVDILETDDELILFGDMPGVEPGDLDIQFENRELILHGKVAPRHEDQKAVSKEFGVGDFYRAFTIGEVIDPSRISAELKDGVLTVHLPKTETVKPRRIHVKAG